MSSNVKYIDRAAAVAGHAGRLTAATATGPACEQRTQNELKPKGVVAQRGEASF